MKTKITILLTSVAFATNVFIVSCSKKNMPAENQPNSIIQPITKGLNATPPINNVNLGGPTIGFSLNMCWLKSCIPGPGGYRCTYTVRYVPATTCFTCPAPNVYYRTYVNSQGAGLWSLFSSYSVINPASFPYFEYVVGGNSSPSAFATGTILTSICP
jgi:hypothetical protein